MVGPTGGPWFRERAAIVVFRLRAARYGASIRWQARTGTATGVVELTASVLGLVFAVLGPPSIAVGVGISLEPWQSAVLGLALIVAWSVLAVRLVRAAGSLPRIIGAAAGSERTAGRLRRDMQLGMQNPLLYRYLRELYEPFVDAANRALAEAGCRTSFVVVDGVPGADGATRSYAVAAMRLDTGSALSTILGELGARANTTTLWPLTGARQRLVLAWRKGVEYDRETGLHFEEGDNYCLREIRVEADVVPRVVLDACVGSYGQVSRSCEALVNESALFGYLLGSTRTSVGGRLPMRSASVLGCLPWRKAVHEEAGLMADLLLRPKGRAVGLGIAVVTTTRAAGGRRLARLGIRSHDVGTYPGAEHVIPAGNCNTHETDGVVDGARVPAWYLETIMRCEFLEEWFNDHDLERSVMPHWKEQVNERWRRRIRTDVSFELTGLAFDFLNLRPDICAMVDWDPRRGNINWEWKRLLPAIDLRDAGTRNPEGMVQAAAGALYLAARRCEAPVDSSMEAGSGSQLPPSPSA
jgi:hypothetical protein